MHVLHQHRIRNGMLAGTMAVAIGLVGGTAGAQAAVNCTVSAGVTQVGNLVVGTGGLTTSTARSRTPARSSVAWAGTTSSPARRSSTRSTAAPATTTSTAAPRAASEATA